MFPALRSLRNIEDIRQLAASVHLQLCEDIAMPANNRLLVLVKESITADV